VNPAELSTRLHDAAAGVEPAPDFAAAVLRGGQARRQRRRLAVAASAVAVVALVASGAFALTRDHQEAQVGDPRVTQPTRGDLAGDDTFRQAAIAAWQRSRTTSASALNAKYETIGGPHVYWAGSTPAGPAAIVLQQVDLRPEPDSAPDWEGATTVEALVATDPADGQLKVVADDWSPHPEQQLGFGAKFGPGDRTVLIETSEQTLFFSEGVELRNHRLVRDWQQVPVLDGVAQVQLPADADPAGVLVVARETKPGPEDTKSSNALLLTRAAVYRSMGSSLTIGEDFYPPPTGLRWPGRYLSVGDPVDQREVDRTYTENVFGKLPTGDWCSFGGSWWVAATLPDGTIAVLSDVQADANPARLYGLLIRPDGSTEVYDAGEVDAGAPLPARFRLPGGKGWLVADDGKTISYRTETGGWQDAGSNAALLPDDAVEAKVGDTTVPLG